LALTRYRRQHSLIGMVCTIDFALRLVIGRLGPRRLVHVPQPRSRARGNTAGAHRSAQQSVGVRYTVAAYVSACGLRQNEPSKPLRAATTRRDGGTGAGWRASTHVASSGNATQASKTGLETWSATFSVGNRLPRFDVMVVPVMNPGQVRPPRSAVGSSMHRGAEAPEHSHDLSTDYCSSQPYGDGCGHTHGLQIRVVLAWGADPPDLDVRLVTPTGACDRCVA
jgi:hypothetical protein